MPVGSPGGDQSKQKQAPAVTESIDNDGPTPPQKGFHGHMFSKTTMSSRPGPNPNHLKIPSSVSIASSRRDRHLLETSCIPPVEPQAPPAMLPAQDLVR